MHTPAMPDVPALADAEEMSCDVLVIGGGTARTMAALTAVEHGATALLLEKAHVRHSGALAMGMDGVNNAVIPGRATPEDYIAEITRANDGVVDQATVRQTATRGYAMVKRLEKYGVKFEKDEHGEYAVRRVHRSGSYVVPMPEGKDVKKVLYRVMRRREMRERIRIENRVMPVRVLTVGGRAVGAAGFHTRTGRFVTVRAGAVILATGAAGRPACTGELPARQIREAHELVYRPLGNPQGSQQQVEYKLRRFVNDYVAPPKIGARLSLAVEASDRMRGEIEAMGGVTPHELMRCAEVSFIRDCAEMAARASLARAESRWGLYHERTDLPARDDGTWLVHLNLRKSAGGSMEFLTRPVAPYLVPVEGFDPPSGGGVRLLGEVALEQVATAGSREVPPVDRLAGPDLFAPALRDPDPRVRIEAVRGLLALGAAGECAPVLDDASREVRVALAKGLAADDTGRALLGRLARDADPLVRSAAPESLGSDGPLLGDLEEVVLAALRDPQWRVRKGAAVALGVCPSGVPALLTVAKDEHPDVRRAAVDSLAVHAADGDPAVHEALRAAVADPDADGRAYARLALAASPAE